MLGLPYAPRSPDPVVMDLKTAVVSKKQPYIGRLTRLGIAAAERGKGLQLLREISAVIFGGTRDRHLGVHLVRAVARSGLDLAELDRVTEVDSDRYEAAIADNEAAQKGAGHWGVPLMVFNGEPFFGRDRFEALKWRMAQKGLQRRAQGRWGTLMRPPQWQKWV